MKLCTLLQNFSLERLTLSPLIVSLKLAMPFY